MTKPTGTVSKDQTLASLLAHARAHFNFEDAITAWANQTILAAELLQDLQATLADQGITLDRWRRSRENKLNAVRAQKAAEHTLHERKAEASQRGRVGADALHNRPHGDRWKKAEIQKLWASGKYTTRDICAEQECAAFDMSFSTARKALRNTPNPT